MLLLVVLLAQVVGPSDDAQPITPLGDSTRLHQYWEELNSACRKQPPDSEEGLAICNQRNVLGWQLGQLGWCLVPQGLQIKWEMCPRTGR
jgi:hypothetical protein